MLDVQATGAGLTWSVGCQYQLSCATTLGLAFQSATRFYMDGNTLIAVPQLGESRFDSRLDVTWPRSLGIGLQHRLCPHRRLGLDVLWFDWSDAYDYFQLKLTDAENPLFAAVVGPELIEQFPLLWRDTLSVRLGYEHELSNNRVARCGYIYHRNPIPDATLTPFIQATLEHGVSAGYGWQHGPWHIDLAYQFSFGQDHSVVDSDIVGGDFDSSYHRSHVHWAFISLLRRH
jgi:long-subunit fatty acid transport protein